MTFFSRLAGGRKSTEVLGIGESQIQAIVLFIVFVLGRMIATPSITLINICRESHDK